MSTLEMKELNERQRAEHATMMYEQQKKQLRLAEDRICEIENKFSKVTFMILWSFFDSLVFAYLKYYKKYYKITIKDFIKMFVLLN